MLCGFNSTVSCPNVYCPSTPTARDGGNYTASVYFTPTTITKSAEAIAHIKCSPWDICTLIGCNSDIPVNWGFVNKTQLYLGAVSYDVHQAITQDNKYFNYNATITASASGLASVSASVLATTLVSATPHTSIAMTYGRTPLDITPLLFLCIFTMFIFKKAC